MTDNSSTTEAIKAMRQRGIDDPENLVSSTTADRIIATCKWYDGLKGVSKGLLVKRIKEGGVDPEFDTPKIDKRQRFEQLTRMFLEGNITESHARLQQRRGYDDEPCPGDMVVTEPPSYPSLMVECDACGFQAAYVYRSLLAGVLPQTERSF